MLTLAKDGLSVYRITMAHPAHETIKQACDECHEREA